MFRLYIDEDSADRNLVQALKVMAIKSAADMRNSVEFLNSWG